MKRYPCKFCGEPVHWATNRKTGNRAPIDVEPDSTHGKILLDPETMTYTILRFQMIENAVEREFPLYTNHLGTCLARKRKGSPAHEDRELAQC